MERIPVSSTPAATFDPIDLNLVYFWNEFGIYKSNDKGVTVEQISELFSVTQVLIDPYNSQTLFIIADHFYKSTDGGVTSNLLAAPPDRRSASVITALPDRNSFLLATRYGVILQTLDGGQSWQPLSHVELQPDPESECDHIYYCSPSDLWAQDEKHRLAKKGVLFRKAFSLIPITLPSHTAILSSHPPEELRLFNNGDHYDGHWPLLPDFLGNHRYHTAGFISLPVLSSVFGLGHHFDWFEDNFENCNGRRYKVASEMNAVALPWIEKQRKNRFFAWIHYSDPHEPYVTVDAPPDTQIKINGVDFGKYCFRKKEVIVLNFMATPGRESSGVFSTYRSASAKVQNRKQRYLENRTSITPFGEMELSYASEWKNFVLPAGIPARYFQLRVF